jgi:hypothetical protein
MPCGIIISIFKGLIQTAMSLYPKKRTIFVNAFQILLIKDKTRLANLDALSLHYKIN